MRLRNKKWKRVLSGFLVGIFTVGMIAGCSGSGAVKGKNDGKTDSSQNGTVGDVSGGAMGRYREEDLKAPVQSGEMPLGLWEKDGSLWLYTSLGNEEEGKQYFQYQYQNGTWSDPVREDSMIQADRETGISVWKVVPGADGKVYGIGIMNSETEAYGSRILTQNEEGTAWSDITPGEILKVDEGGYARRIVDLNVLSDGRLCAVNMNTNQLEVYQDGNKVFSADVQSLEQDQEECMEVSGDTIAVIGENRKTIQFYSTADYSKTGEFAWEEELDYDCNLLAGKDEGIWYYVNNKGIHRMQAGGSILETVMDGSYGKMSNQDWYIKGFCQGEGEEFYGAYKNKSTGEMSVCKYTYDQNVSAVADDTLTVYSLTENKTVQQAVSYFQGLHPEVKVDYTFAVPEGEKVTSDQVRTLNVQILNGKGPDVMILDGMPVESYIEKGILADLSEMMDGLRAQGVLVDIIGKTGASGEGRYALPARIGLPIVFGDARAEEALGSLDSLEQYLRENPEGKLFNYVYHDMAFKVLFSSLYPELMQDGKLNQTNLARLYQCWQTVCNNQNTRHLEEFYEYNKDNFYYTARNFDTLNIAVLNEGRITVTELKSVMDMMAPCYQMKENGLSPQVVRKYFVPYTLAGVNASSGNPETAKEFVMALFADEVQKSQTGDGFSVTENGLAALADYVELDTNKDIVIGSSCLNPDTGEEVEITCGYPDRATIENYARMIRELEKPFLPDQVLLDAGLEEMENCYEGNQTPEGAAQAVAQKMDTYLSE